MCKIASDTFDNTKSVIHITEGKNISFFSKILEQFPSMPVPAPDSETAATYM